MNLSAFIRQHSESILGDWTGPEDLLPPLNNGHGCRPRLGYLPEILVAAADHIAADPSQGGSGQNRAGPDSDRTAETAAVLNSWARRHAVHRQAQDCTSSDVVEEFQLLRARVTGCWRRQARGASAGLLDQVILFNDAVDRALATAVACYDTSLRQAARQQAELHARLAQSEQRFRALVTASSHVVYRMSPDGTEMRELDGRGTVSDTRRPSKSWLDEYIHPDDQPVAVRAFQEAFRKKTFYEVEHRYRRVNGKVGWTLSRAVPLFDDQGRITEWFGAATDVTARRQVEETLREADRRKEEFLVMLGHELRNPLAPLRACVDLLDEGQRRPELLADLRPMMDRQLSHLVRLVDDLLDISRISRGQIALQQAALDLNAPVQAAIEQARGIIRERGHELRVQLSPVTLPIHGDAVRLTQVVANLLNNAAKFMEPGGTVHVSCAAEGSQAVVRVRDTGYGIAPEHFGKLFKLFTQLDEHLPHAQRSGLGVGLALSRQLVTLHGGSIEAASEGPGCGSEFIVRLDLIERQENAPEADHER